MTTSFACAVVGARGHSLFLLHVNSGATFGDAKVAAKEALPSYLRDVSADEVMLFPARNERGEFLQADSRKFRDGETRGLEGLLRRELQFDSGGRVSDFFCGAEPDLDFVHVLIVSPLRNVRCATLGTWKGLITVRVDVTKSLQTLRHTIAVKAKLPEDALEFFLPVGRDGEWISCGFEDTEDSWALSLGKTTDNIEFMLRDEAKILDPFILVTAPDLGTCNVHLLATLRGRTLRKSAIRILGERARYWDKLDYYLYDSTRSGEDDDGPVRLKRVTWWDLKFRYSRTTSTLGYPRIENELIPALTKELGQEEALAMRRSSDVLVDLLVSKILQTVLTIEGSPMEIQSRYPLESFMRILDVEGYADFMLFHDDKYVCVMEATDPESSDDEEESDSENDDDDDEGGRTSKYQVKQSPMKTGLAHLLVAMEMLNTHVSRKVTGIVTDYYEWWFVSLTYESEAATPVVSINKDNLMAGPFEISVARIVGKLVTLIR